MRLHPISEFLTREVTKTYKVPNSDLVLDKGFCVVIPVIDIHKNPKYFPNPDVFDPDRFSPERKSEIIPYSFMPFGHGPRYCIGMLEFSIIFGVYILHTVCIKFQTALLKNHVFK